MSKNIEMNYKTESSYEVVYPKTVSDICLSSDELKTLFSLNDESVIDDAFEYISRQLILMKYNKAGINVTVKSAGGSPLEGVPIPNITANYDGTGEVVTGSDGTAFGYCDAGSVNIAPVKCVDVSYTSQSVQTLVGEMYNVEITGTIKNYVEYTSSGTVRFSKNVQTLDVCCLAGGGGGGGRLSSSLYNTYGSGAGGAGGESVIQYGISNINYNSAIPFQVGTGGRGAYTNNRGYVYEAASGGNSTFQSIIATGGERGGDPYASNGEFEAAVGPSGNGKGADGVIGTGVYSGKAGGAGDQYIFDGFLNLKLSGGGGGSGAVNFGTQRNRYGGNGGSPGGGAGGSYGEDLTVQDTWGKAGTDGLGGGGGGECGSDMSYAEEARQVGGNGGIGIVQFRMHLKVTS